MLDLNDRFDYYVCMMLKDDKLSLAALAMPHQEDPSSPKLFIPKTSNIDSQQKQILT